MCGGGGGGGGGRGNVGGMSLGKVYSDVRNDWKRFSALIITTRVVQKVLSLIGFLGFIPGIF